MLRKLFTYSVLVLFSITFFACKQTKETADGKPSRGSNEIEPEQLTPRVDTRFQEAFFQAQLEKSKNNPSKAYQLFQECLKIEPKSAAVNYELGRMELELFNNPDNAIAHAKASVEVDKNNIWYQKLLGDTYMALNKFDLAVKAYKEMQRINPEDQEVLYLQANALLYGGKTQEAIATYDLLEKETGPYEELSLQKHQLYLHVGNNDKAGLELEKLAKAFPEEPRYWGLAAQFYQKAGMTEKAKLATEQMVKNAPDNGQVHFQLSELYAATGEDKKSFEELKLAFATTDVTIDQKIAVLLRYYSLTEKEPRYLPSAYELMVLTEQMHPSEAKAYSIYGDFLYRDGKAAEALAKYRKAAELDPSRQLIWEQILIVEGELAEFVQMEVDSKNALELFPTIPQFYLFNGIAHQQLKNYSKAIESYNLGKELVIEDDEMLMRFYSYLGEVYNKQKLFEKSDEAYDKALNIDGNNVFVLNNYAYYLTLRKVKLDKAAQMAKKANELAPNQASFEDTYAWVLFQQEKYSEARVWIERSISHTTPNAELLEHYGDILFKAGNTSEALMQWKKAKELGGASSLIDRKINEQKYIE